LPELIEFKSAPIVEPHAKTGSVLRIAIVTTGRFHVADLAREFAHAGHIVTFYSMVPPSRLLTFGLDSTSVDTVLLPVAHLYAASRAAPTRALRGHFLRLMTTHFDLQVAKRLKECDVLIGMSGICVEAARTARRLWGAKIYIERGSRHILSQRKILSELPHAEQVGDWQVEREMQSYEIADVVTVLSRHCEDSFIEEGFPRDRLFRNPLGVKLSDFPVADRTAVDIPTVIMAGTWCWRKGADMFELAARRMPNVNFVHVGSVGDYSIPQLKNFRHLEKVEQRQLRHLYARAHVFCLASREEGMATVIPQALASGLRVVCSDRTGGDDLRGFLDDEERMSSFPSDDMDGMLAALQQQIDRSRYDVPLQRSLSELGASYLSWASSAERYISRMRRDINLGSERFLDREHLIAEVN